MKLSFFILIFFSISTVNYSQGNIEKLVLEKVNLLRDSLELSPLKYDEILSVAGKDQAYYMSLKKKLTHFQKTFTKESPAARVEYYQGNRSYIGENVARTPTKFTKSKKLDEVFIAHQLFLGWLNSPPHFANMINPDYTKMGLGFLISNKKYIYAAQVFSSNEIKLPKEFVNSDRSWGVRPSEFSCKDETQIYETMFFANGIQVEGNSIYFYFHDIDFFKNVIESENDGLALDIILREQLPCDKENQFHISTIHDGEMQRPIYKNDIYRNDISNNPKKIKIKIGEVPSYVRDKQWEPNVIIINNNKLCDYSYPVEVPSDVFPLLLLDPYYDSNDSVGFPIKKITTRIKDSIHVELLYERSQEKFFTHGAQEFNRLLDWSHFIEEINVDCFASVEGANWFNMQLLEGRKESVSNLLLNNSFDLNKVKISTEENWSEMNSQIAKYSIEKLTNKTNAQIKSYLKRNRSTFFDSLLFDQRKTHVYATIDTTLEINHYHDLKLASYYDSTITLNTLPWNTILREDYILTKNDIDIFLVDSLKDRVELKTNLLGAISINNVNTYIDSILVKQLLKNLDKNNSKQVFNYAHFLTKYWFSKYARFYETIGVASTIEPNELLEIITNLDTNKIEIIDLTRLEVNVLLSGIHYYVAHNNWLPVDDYFNAISKLVKSNNFTAQESMELALFCNHFHKFELAVKILHPFHEKNLLSEDGYFVLAKTSTLIRGELEQTIYRNYMETAKKANHKRYCNWLDTSFQIQRDEFIKNDFCSECQ